MPRLSEDLRLIIRQAPTDNGTFGILTTYADNMQYQMLFVCYLRTVLICRRLIFRMKGILDSVSS